MTRSIILEERTNIAALADFFDQAGPNARIRARQSESGEGIELYVRDMSFSGRLKDALFIKENDIKKAYDTAKSIIAESARRSAKYSKNSEFLQTVLTSISNHQHDFYAKEIGRSIDRLSDRYRQGDAKDAVELGMRALETLEKRNMNEQLSSMSDEKIREMAYEVCRLLGKPDHQEVIEEGLNALREYAQTEKNGSGSGTDSINFVSIRQFQMAFLDALAICDSRAEKGDSSGSRIIAQSNMAPSFRTAFTATRELSAPKNYVFATHDTPSDAFVIDEASHAPEVKDPSIKREFKCMQSGKINVSSFWYRESLLAKPRFATLIPPEKDGFSSDVLSSTYASIARNLVGEIKNQEPFSVRLPVYIPRTDPESTPSERGQAGAEIFAEEFFVLMHRNPQVQFKIVLPTGISQLDFIGALEESARSRRRNLLKSGRAYG